MTTLSALSIFPETDAQKTRVVIRPRLLLDCLLNGLPCMLLAARFLTSKKYLQQGWRAEEASRSFAIYYTGKGNGAFQHSIVFTHFSPISDVTQTL